MIRFFQKTGIGRTSIKESIDNLPNGICFADKEGIVVLCNRQMHRLCYVLMGMDLQHICELRNALKNPRSEIVAINPSMFVYLFPDGRVWQFSECALMDSDGRAYTQMQAVEVTMLYEKKAELQKENTALNEANARAKKLYSELDRIVREEESFAVKAHVHDEVGLLLLSSRKLLKQPQSNLVELQRIGKMWSKMAKRLGLPEQAEGRLYRMHPGRHCVN
ncbi:MAG: hypothetical protein PUB98_03400 [Clostridiales bacterium]|nr:hypothetical protein [Clostridiales bacterium]